MRIKSAIENENVSLQKKKKNCIWNWKGCSYSERSTHAVGIVNA